MEQLKREDEESDREHIKSEVSIQCRWKRKIWMCDSEVPEVWVSDRNIGVARLYVILKVLRLDKITKEISVDGEKKKKGTKN